MNNKTKNVKWTKKLRAVIISLALVFAVALGGACAAIGLSLSNKNDRLNDGYLAGGVTDSAEPTVNIGKTIEVSSADMWAEVIEAAAESSEDSYVQAKLVKNITATGGSFGTAENAYKGGALNVPVGKYIVLDLNGFTVNRGLTEATDGGSVITTSGNLVIKDSSSKGNGKITGGYTSENGGGVYADGGKLTIAGGTILKNTAGRGGGVCALTPCELTIVGGTISGNTTTVGSGGGVIFDKTFNMTGGTISGNSSINSGAGVHIGGSGSFTMSGGTISGNTATSRGGGVGVFDQGTFTYEGGTITGNTATGHGGGVYVDTATTFEMTGGTIEKNDAGGDGGGIYSTGTIIMENGEVSNNTAANGSVGVYSRGIFKMLGGEIHDNKTTTKSGGGLYVTGESFEMSGGKIYNNTAVRGGGMVLRQVDVTISGTAEIYGNKAVKNGTDGGHGGGVYLQNTGTKVITGGKIYNNTAEGEGGGIILNATDSSLEISGGEIYNNKATKGGGILADTGTILTLNDGVSISNNTASESGGGICVNASVNFTMNGGEISGNTAGSGGGIYTLAAGEKNADGSVKTYGATISNATISNNTAKGAGGGICTNSNTTTKVTNSTISDNEGNYGGGVYASGRVDFSGGEINGNKANSNGGGMYAEGAAVTMTGTTISGNNTAGNGGGINVKSNSLTITDATILNNKALGSGGGINTSGTLKIIGGTMSGNSAVDDGGVLCTVSNSETTVTGGTISGNTAGRDGGYVNNEGTLIMDGVTLTGNSTKLRGGAIYNGAYGTANVKSCTITGNTSVNGGGIYNRGTASLTGITITGNEALNDGGGIYQYGVLRFVGSAKITIKNNTSGQFTNNLYLRTDKDIGIFESAHSVDVGVSAEAASARFIGGYGTALPYSNTAQTGFFPDNKDRYQVDQTTDGTYYYYTLNRKTVTGTNASRWETAVSTSLNSNGAVQLFELTGDWTATSGKFGTDETAYYNGSLNVPAGCEIVLDLKNFNLTNTTRVIRVQGKLTIKGNGTITGGTTSGHGAVINVSGNGEVTLNGGTIKGGKTTSGYNGGGIAVIGSSKFTMNGGTISGNTAASNSGGVYVQSAATFVMNGGTISGNTASDNGGGVYIGGTFEMNGGTISGNTADQRGGGVAIVGGGEFTMNGGTIGGSTDNANKTTGSAGGGVYGEYAKSITINGGTISYNATGKNFPGGGLFILNENQTTTNLVTTLTITGGKICNNTTGAGAGAGARISAGYNGKVIFNMSGGEFSANTTTNNGGALSINGRVITTITGGNIINNEAANGAGIYLNIMQEPEYSLNIGEKNGDVLSGNAKISGNTASVNGGGIYALLGTLNVYGGTISGNEANLGGGVYVDADGSFTMNGGTIGGSEANKNTATDCGGGVYIAIDGEFEMNGGTISYNTAKEHAGVLMNGPSTMNGGTISYNEATKLGGGVATGTLFTMNGGTIMNNKSGGNAGGIYVGSLGSFTMNGGRITGNEATGSGGGIYQGANTVNILGGEISGNTANGNGGGIYTVKGTLNIGAKDEETGELTGTAVISGNTATTTNGGGVYGHTGSTVAISGGTISKNTAVRGGGLYIYNGTLTISGDDTEICENKAVRASNNTGGYGGGIYLNYDKNNTGDKTNVISGGSIYKNDAVGDGGMIIGNSSSYKAILKFTGGAIYSNTATSSAGGLSVESGAEVQMSGTAEIYENTASDNGGGVTIASSGGASLSGGKLVMTGGSIHNNDAGDFGGGGIVVSAKCTLEISGTAVISENTSTGNGGGVYVSGATSTTSGDTTTTKPAGTFTMSGGTISGNTAGTNGGGVYNAGTFTMNGGTINGNTATGSGGGIFAAGNAKVNLLSGNNKIENNDAGINGGGLFLGGTSKVVMSGGSISGNTTTNNGGGVYIVNGTTVEMSDGKISGNSGTRGGGVYIEILNTVVGTLKMTGGTISGNKATLYGGGVYNDSTFNVSGTPVVTDNTLEDDTLNNVYLPSGKKITVTAALTSEAEIGVTAEDSTVVFTSGFGSKSGLAHPNLAFTADDAQYIVGTNGSTGSAMEAKFAECYNINITVYDKNGQVTDKTALVKVDKDTNVTYERAAEKFTFKTTQGGGALNAIVNAPKVDGYTPYLYSAADATKTELATSGAEVFTPVNANRNLRIGYRANTDTEYTVWYLLQQPDGSYYEVSASDTTWQSYAKKYVGHGATDRPLVYLDEDGRALATWSEKQHYSFASINVENPTVGGDGKTVVYVKMSLNEYTVRYAASGASPSLQTQRYKYGEKISATKLTIDNKTLTEPVKDLSTFAGWYFDAQCTNPVTFGEDGIIVSEDMTIYPKFNAKPYTLIFDMNVGTGTNQLDLDNVLAYDDADWENNKIYWNTSAMFGASFNFGKATGDNAGDGRYSITYDTNNITTNTKSITTTKPSAIGYDFLGWFASETATAQTSVIYKPRKNVTQEVITLTARWKPKTYNVTFDSCDGSNKVVKPIENLSLWGHQDESQNFTEAGTVLPSAPVRSGYTFMGWYVTAAAAADPGAGGTGEGLSIYNTSAQPDENGNVYFSIANFGAFQPDEETYLTPYGDPSQGFDFSKLTLYAGWKSVDVYIKEVNKNASRGTLAFTNAEGNSISTETDKVHIGDKITITPSAVNPDPKTGYKFKSLTAGNQTPKLKDGVLSFTITGRDVVAGADGKLYINVEAVFELATFTISYHSNGGRIGDTSFKRTYKASDFIDGQESEIKMPSRVTKRGYEFAGWIFESTADDRDPQLAHRKLAAGETTYFGLDLRMVQAVDDEQNLTYRDVTLLAKWEAKPSFVYLFNASYSGEYDKPSENASYYMIDKYHSNELVTDMEIEIINPSRGDSFVFLGWATTRGGAVVYPAVEGENSIEYTVFADTDENGAALNRNNLYAVWRVAGIDYVTMTATNNGCTYTYGGDGIKMTATPSREYETGITLTYKWYKVSDGMYNQCFVTKDYEDDKGFKWYLNADGEIKAYEKAGKYYDADKNEISELPEGLTKLTYKEFDPTSVGTACVQKNPTTNSPTLTIRNVADCGIYICVVEATGGENEGKDTEYGEIEITMNKAVYGGLSLANSEVTYNSKARNNAIEVKQGTNSATLGENGLRTFTLPDGSKVVVTYRYFVGEGELREEITDLNLIKNVGVYHVEASFAFALGGDKGNYEPLGTLEADLTIRADEINNFEFVFMHGGEESELDFKGTYDGSEYGVKIVIKDTFGTGGKLVTEVDDLAVELEVYLVHEDGDELVTDPTINAGEYYVVIVGLMGDDVDNYILGDLAETSKTYTIEKKKHDVDGHIQFEDATAVYDEEAHTIGIKIDNGLELPSTVRVTYNVESYVAEAADFTDDDNIVEGKNGGIHAGVYTIRVTFTDSASANYKELESKTATLTIKQANFLNFYNKDGADLLRDAGFVNASYAYDTSTHHNPYIKSGLLTDKEHFEAIEYEYYRLTEVNGEVTGRTLLASGTYNDIKDDDSISLAGKYEIVAQISYKSPLFKNDFEEIPEADRTITYVIREMAVKSVTVTAWKDGFDMGATLGTAFDYSWIKEIEVEYESETEGKRNVLTIYKESDIALAGIKLEEKNGAAQTTFWHVGTFNVIVSFYGTESEAYEFNVIEEVTNVVLKYNKDGSDNYTAVPDEGLEMLTEGSYNFVVEYDCTDANGNTVRGKRTTATVAAGGLVLGTNELTLSENLYTFKLGDTDDVINVEIYKVISSVTWKYSLDGENWEAIPNTNELVYAGKEYKISATFTDGGDEQYCEAKATMGATVLNANANGYDLVVGRSGNYKVIAEYTLIIKPKVLEFTWDPEDLKLEYNTWHRSPEATTGDIEEVDKDSITLSYEYYDENGDSLTAAQVVNVGTYSVKVVLRGDAAARSNYTLENSLSAQKTFYITQAEIKMTAVYSESNYGENVTFAGNSQLRQDALKANFGENTFVDGEFRFITNYNEETGEYEIVEDGKALASLIAEQGDPDVWYVYVPGNKNYKDKVGTVKLDVRKQNPMEGSGALSVEFGEDAVQFYLVNQRFETHGIEVYQLYESSYQEKGEWYGKRTKVETPMFRINSMVAEGYIITSQDLSSEMVVLVARSGGNTGTLNVPVVDKVATGLQLSSTDYKKVYYVGETPDFSGLVFRVLFGDGSNPHEGLTFGTVKVDSSFTGFTEAGEATVTFKYFNVPCPVKFEVKAKEDLQIQDPTNTVLTWKGDDTKLDPPQLTFIVDGKPYAQDAIDGVKVTYNVYQNGSPATLAKEGEYTVRYSFTITNPRFNQHGVYSLDVKVTTNPYSVEFDVPEIRSSTYTGKSITIPMITRSSVKDTTDGNNPVPDSYIETVYKINGTDVVSWQRVNAGTYEVLVIVKVKAYKGHGEYEAGRASYTYTITQADNDPGNMSIEVPKSVILGKTDFEFDVNADFGEDKVVYTYCTSSDGVFTAEKPNAIGIWFVKATIPETDNYKGVDKTASFEVRTDVGLENSNGSISGGNGIGKDWSLEIKQMETEEVSQVSISKQNVLDGYEVVLKDEHGVKISGEGEYTVRVKLSEELSGRTDLKVFFKGADGKTSEKKASVKDGYIEFKMSDFDGRVIITNAVAEVKSPVGLIVAVSLLAVIAAGLIVLCIIIFIKKRKGEQK